MTSTTYLHESPDFGNGLKNGREFSEENWIVFSLRCLIPGWAYENIMSNIGIPFPELENENNFAAVSRHIKLILSGI